MNKTIIININGTIFHIEEDAYEILKNYMIEVKLHFTYTKDNEEIVADIESRIAEMLTERLETDRKQVIVVADVEEVIAKMGRVKDFETEDADETSYSGSILDERKLYRDLDDRVLGGVCSGIGHYFNIEARWVRLSLFLLTLIGGSGFVVYIILWIVMPPARTRAEKMAMKGEALNLQNSKKNFDEELEYLKHNFSKASRHVRPGLTNAGKSLLDFVGKALKLVVKFIGVLIIAFGVLFLLTLAVGLFALLGFWNTTELSHFPFNIINPEYQSAIYFSAFVLVIIPVAALILFTVRAVFNRRIITKTGSFVLLLLWLTGLFLGIYFGTKVGAQFSSDASFSERTNLDTASTFYLKLDDTKLLTSSDSAELNLSGNEFRRRVIINEEWNGNSPRAVSLDIERSEISSPVLTQIYSSQGSNFETALQNAKKIKYRFSQKDSVLLFNNNIGLQKNALWRNQEVKLKLYIPLNTKLIIDSKLEFILNNYNLWDCKPKNIEGHFNSEWLMTLEGLKCNTDTALLENHSG